MGPIQRVRMNHMIRISPVRVIGPHNEQIGVIDTDEARRMAAEQGLDLVEIQPDVRPPVCKIMDYGKHKYEQSKKQQKSRANARQQEMKEIRLGRSVKIDPHDVKIRVDQARKFLMAGHKVQLTQRFRGREMMHKELGIERLRNICIDLGDISKVEQTPRWVGRQTSIVLAPDRDKIKALMAKMTREEQAKLAKDVEEAEEQRLRDVEEDEAQQELEDLAELDPEVQAEVEAALANFDEEEATITKDEAIRQAKQRAKKEKAKGPADDRAKDPIAAELDDLLG
jgi:translation initiation factor IF-3